MNIQRKQPLRQEERVTVSDRSDIITARERARFLAAQAGFSASELTLITTALSEIARNVLEHAGRGEVSLSVLQNGTKNGVKIVVTDQGPGISDVAQAMQDGYSSRAGMGIGLAGSKRLMDEFEIRTYIGHGTTVTMKKWHWTGRA